VAEELVQDSLKAAIAESLFNCLDDCDIDLQEKTAVGVFQVPQDMSFEEALFWLSGISRGRFLSKESVCYPYC
jgi:hypothetical protein